MIDITCKTDRFNLSVAGPDFTNDCCFGEDFSRWLVTSLCAMGIDADVVCMEDFGWANRAAYQGVSYLVHVTGSSLEDRSRPDYGEWHVVLDRQRSFVQKLLGRNKTSATDPIVGKVVQLLQAAAFPDVMVAP